MQPDSSLRGSIPVQPLEHPLFDKAGIHVSVLRLDELHPVISGNKWMKLLPWLKILNEKGLHGFVSKGGPYSNHLHAAAYTAFIHGLTCTAIVKAPNGFMTPTLSDVLQWDAKIIYAPADFEDDEKWGALATVERQLFVPMGGEGAIGVQGVSSFFKQLELPGFDHLVCAVGTGTTLLGIAEAGIHRQSLTGINPGIEDDFPGLVRALSPGVHIHRFPELKRFGWYPAFLPGMMNEWFERWQLPTDIVYTAKMIHGFFELVRGGQFPPGSTCLLIHTGGLQGNRSLGAGVLDF